MSLYAVHGAASEGPWPSVTGTAGGNVARKIAEFKERRVGGKGLVVGGLDFNQDGTQVATSGQVAAPEVHIWNWRARDQARVLPMSSSAGGEQAIRYSGDGRLLAVAHGPDAMAHDYGVVQIWDTHSWAPVHDIAEPHNGRTGGLAFSPDGKLLVRTVKYQWPGVYLAAYRTDTWEQAWAVQTPRTWLVDTLAIRPDGRLMAVAGRTFDVGHLPIVHHPQILIVGVSSQKVVRTIVEAFPDNNEIKTLAWSADGQSLAAGALVTETAPGPDAVRIFDPVSGKQVVGEAATDAAFVSGLSYSPDGRYLAEGYIDGKVRIWDGLHKHLLQSIPVNDHFHTVLSISRDSRYLAIAAGYDVSIWELR